MCRWHCRPDSRRAADHGGGVGVADLQWPQELDRPEPCSPRTSDVGIGQVWLLCLRRRGDWRSANYLGSNVFISWRAGSSPLWSDDVHDIPPVTHCEPLAAPIIA